MAAHKLRLNKKQREEVEHDRLAEDQWHRYVRARDNGHLQYLDIAQKCNRFYIGEQWDIKQKKKLEAQGRPALTINLVLSTVNAVLGEQTSKRVEFRYKPRVGGTEAVSTVLTKLASSIKDANQYDWVESNVFADGIIQHGRGFFDIRMKFDEHMQGDISIRADDPSSIILDPDAKEYDPSTWKELYETRWMSIDEVEASYGQKKADEIRTLGINADRFGTDSLVWEEQTFGDAREQEMSEMGMHLSLSEEKTIRKIRVIQRQHMKLVPVRKFVDATAGDMSVVPETWSDPRAKKFAEKMGLFIISVVDKRIRWTTTADKVILHDAWSPYRTYTKIPYFAYFRRGRPFGLVTNLISPQEQLNKLSSQELHILNTTANSGWMVQAGSLVGMTIDDLRNQGGETGLVIEYNRTTNPPEKIQPNKPPTGIERASIKSAGYMKEISGINEATLGFDSPEVSGVALENKQFRAQIQLQVPLDNLERTRHFVGKKILELIQQFYTEERVFNVTTEGMKFDEEDEDDVELLVNHKLASGEIVNDLTVGKYEVVQASMPARDSYDDQQFAEALNMRGAGIAIPDDRIVEYSHLANKEKLAEEIREATGRGKPTEQDIMIQQFELEIRMRTMEAEASQAEREVFKLEAEISKLMAEAQMKGGGVDSPEYQLEIERLEVQLRIAREGAGLRRTLALQSARATLDNTVLASKGRMIEGVVDQREQRITDASAARFKTTT